MKIRFGLEESPDVPTSASPNKPRTVALTDVAIARAQELKAMVVSHLRCPPSRVGRAGDGRRLSHHR